MSIFDTTDDFDLCDRVFSRLADNPINLDTCGELERVVRLVWDSSGLIGNGGFHRLFEGDYAGDPGFVYTCAAYKRIGAQGAYEALQAAFRQFPGAVLPAEIGKRLSVFESLPRQTWEEIEGRYYDADKETELCLARFIREHRSGYEQLLVARKAEPGASLSGGPVPQVGNSEAADGPSSVS